jgi:hypothetical protein
MPLAGGAGMIEKQDNISLICTMERMKNDRRPEIRSAAVRNLRRHHCAEHSSAERCRSWPMRKPTAKASTGARLASQPNMLLWAPFGTTLTPVPPRLGCERMSERSMGQRALVARGLTNIDNDPNIPRLRRQPMLGCLRPGYLGQLPKGRSHKLINEKYCRNARSSD